MSWTNRVFWQEGMFIRAQHFQQQDRWSAASLARSLTVLHPFAHGFAELAIAREMLASGYVSLAAASGLLEDGTVFSLPDEADLPHPLAVPETARDVLVYLAVPRSQRGRAEFGDAARPGRLEAAVLEADDTHTGSPEAAELAVGRLCFRVLLGTDSREGYLALPIARIVEVTPDRRVILDAQFVPPVLNCAASPVLANLLVELAGMLHQRGEAIAARLSAIGARSTTEITDFMLLGRVNGWGAELGHLADTGRLHPEDLYRFLLRVAGELATFTEPGRRPEAFGSYRHEDLARSFAPVLAAIRRSLSAILEQTAVQIPLREHRHGVRVGAITDRTVLAGGSIVLIVKADMPGETLRTLFPSTAKVGAVEHIRELVNVALPGIGLRPLPVAPRQMPFVAGAQYFELERASPHWDAMKNSGGFAIHVSGNLPNLTVELWAVRA